MTIGQSMLPEFDEEMKNTRKMLERVPDDKWGWKPHEKSGTMGWLAGHVGTVPEWIAMTIKTEELDYAPVDGPSYEPPKITNRKELLVAFDKASVEARAALASVSDQEINKGLEAARRQRDFDATARRLYRGMCMNHLIHHRAQLTVYFRLVGVPVPGMYGPSADENEASSNAAAAS
jgi:uncharacterized damage-inducible protein DinB